jgi:dihydrofolate synthase/folylpolyglutamate synthase
VVLTNVAIDHVDYLGGTLASIAREKAGIIKPGVPVVTGERAAEISEILRQRAEEVGAPFYPLAPASVADVAVSPAGTRFRLQTESLDELELLPRDLRPGREAVVRGVAGVRWPGRLQWEQIQGRDWIFDVAHNPAGIGALLEAVGRLAVKEPLVAVVGILGDKDWGAMVSLLQERVDRLILTTPPSAPAGRCWDPERALEVLPPGRARVVRDFSMALEVARGEAAEGTVLVTGSFHTVGDALAELGLAPYGTDPALPPTGSGV